MLGIIADDYTGATDVAGYLARHGTPTVQYFGVPGVDEHVDDSVGAVVIALKSRAVEPDLAVAESLRAADWLISVPRVQHVYFKYCSTFDSTPRGNIGPVALALAERLGEQAVLVAPSAPENGRTVYQGKLFVHDQLLNESPMRNHPVNPMRDSDLRRLLEAQGAAQTALLPHAALQQADEVIASTLTELTRPGGVTLVVADAIYNADLDALARAGAGRSLTSGSAGLGAALGRHLQERRVEPSWPAFPPGRRMVLSGSCSTATLGQINDYARDHPSLKLDGRKDSPVLVQAATEFLTAHAEGEPLVYTSADPAEVAEVQARWGIEGAARHMEAVVAEVARAAVDAGFRTLVVAGGETSGAVVQALGVSSISIGREVAIGVPWCLSRGEEPVALALKSGNFGGETFFRDALDVTRSVTERG